MCVLYILGSINPQHCAAGAGSLLSTTASLKQPLNGSSSCQYSIYISAVQRECQSVCFHSDRCVFSWPVRVPLSLYLMQIKTALAAFATTTYIHSDTTPPPPTHTQTLSLI